MIESREEPRLKRMPQLGFQYLVSVLKTKGVNGEILDQNATPFSIDELVQKLKTGDFLFAGFYTGTTLKSAVVRAIGRIRELACNTPIVIGGPGSVEPKVYLRTGCDIVVHGEGEQTICDIVDHIAADLPIAEIKGISFLERGKVHTAEPREPIQDRTGSPFRIEARSRWNITTTSFCST